MAYTSRSTEAGSPAETVLVRDLATGRVWRADTDARGRPADVGGAASPSLSADGATVAFASLATNLVPGDTNRALDVFVKDLRTGAIRRASVTTSGQEGRGHSYDPCLSADGRTLAFLSAASLVPDDDNGKVDAYVRDLRTGGLRRLRVPGRGTSAEGNTTALCLSADGRRVALAYETDDPGEARGRKRRVLLVADLEPGSAPTARPAWDDPRLGRLARDSRIALSADGRFAAFDALVPDSGGAARRPRRVTYRKDLRTGALTAIIPPDAGGGSPVDTFLGSLSGDGRLVAFWTRSGALVRDDTNGAADVFVRDLEAGTLRRLSVSAAGQEARGESAMPSLSADGRAVAYASTAPNLVAGDANGVSDIFLATTGLEGHAAPANPRR